MSRELGNDQPVYGLQVQLEEDLRSISMTSNIEARQRNMYAPSGQCSRMGPTTWLANARRLYRIRDGAAIGSGRRKVALLGILDAWPEENTRYRWRFMVYLAMKRLQRFNRGS